MNYCPNLTTWQGGVRSPMQFIIYTRYQVLTLHRKVYGERLQCVSALFGGGSVVVGICFESDRYFALLAWEDWTMEAMLLF